MNMAEMVMRDGKLPEVTRYSSTNEIALRHVVVVTRCAVFPKLMVVCLPPLPQ